MYVLYNLREFYLSRICMSITYTKYYIPIIYKYIRSQRKMFEAYCDYLYINIHTFIYIYIICMYNFYYK